MPAKKAVKRAVGNRGTDKLSRASGSNQAAASRGLQQDRDGSAESKRILVVDDEAKTARFLKKGLNEAGFVVDVATNGQDGLQLAQDVDFDLVILDVMLPGLDGWQVLSRLRLAGRATQILFLTARYEINERVRGFEMGADDYLVKPFAFSELLARVRSLMRRTSVRPQDTIRMADLEIDLLRQRATRGGQRLNLTAKEFLLLSLLARHAARSYPGI